jgi:hypothetical protein
MKKSPKKLVLAKETVRTLTEQVLADDVRGGTFSTGCPSRIQNCFATENNSCRC